jgi:predicted transcriptional regulator
MAKKQRKPTNKAKFSVYLDKAIMAKVARKAKLLDRSVNWIVENALSVGISE